MKPDKQKTILLVEDEAVIAFFEKKQLEEKGYSVIHAFNGEQAVKIAVDNTYDIDLIIMDIDLGDGIDGTEAAEEILKFKELPIVFLSSHTEPEVVEKTEKISSYGYVVKNTGIVVLDASIKMALRLFNEKENVRKHQQDLTAANEELESSNEELAISNEQLEQSHREILERDIALQNSENKFRSFFYNINAAVALHEIVTDENNTPVDFTFLDANPTYEEITHLKIDDIIGRRALDIIPNLEKKWINNYGKVAQTGEPMTIIDHSDYLDKYWEVKVFSPKINQFAVAFTDVTERIQNEIDLKKSEEKLHNILDATPFPVAVVDLQDDKIFFWSRSALSHFGHIAPTASEWYDIAYPDAEYRRDVIERWKPFLEKARESGKPVNAGEYRVTCKDGSVRLCELYAAFIPDYLIVTFNDITERKLAEEALQENRERLELVIKGSKDAPWDWNLITNELYYSPQWWRQIGYSPDELPADASLWERLMHPDDHDHVDSVFGGTLTDGGTSYEVEFRLQHKKGYFVPVLSRGIITRDKNGKAVRVTGTNMDLSEINRVERELKENESKFKIIFDYANDGILIADAETKQFIMANSLICRMLGYSPEEIIQLSVKDIHPEESLDDVLYAFEKQFRQEISLSENLPVKRKDGSVFYADINSSPINIDRKNYLMGIFRDITERKLASDRIAEMNTTFLEAERLANIGSWTWNIAENKAQWSEGLFRIYGRSPGDGVPTVDEHMEHIHPDDRAKLEEAIMSSFQTGNYECEYRIIRFDDNSIRNIHARGEVISDSAGRPVRQYGAAIDITEKKESEEKIHESEERYRLLYQTAGIGVGYYTPEGRVISFNEIALKHMELTESEVNGKNLHQLFPEEQADIYQKRIRMTMEKNRLLEFTDEITLPSGNMFF